jgi:hypothetical protein
LRPVRVRDAVQYKYFLNNPTNSIFNVLYKTSFAVKIPNKSDVQNGSIGDQVGENCIRFKVQKVGAGGTA